MFVLLHVIPTILLDPIVGWFFVSFLVVAVLGFPYFLYAMGCVKSTDVCVLLKKHFLVRFL